MNAVMTYATAADQMQRYDAIRRKNAEAAYDRNVQYNGQNQKTLEELEALLTGTNEPEIVHSDQKVQRDQPEQSENQGLQQLDAGQMKKIILPLGKTLEETIVSWRDVRAEANSVPEPTTADHLLAATASAKIIQTESLIALQKREQSVSRPTALQGHAPIETAASMERSDREILLLQKRYQQAISSYSFQTKAKQNGFQIEWPSFYKIA